MTLHKDGIDEMEGRKKDNYSRSFQKCLDRVMLNTQETAQTCARKSHRLLRVYTSHVVLCLLLPSVEVASSKATFYATIFGWG